MKTCSKCKEVLDESLFNSNKSRKDGLNHRCKPCQRQENIEWQKKNPELVKARNARTRAKHLELWRARSRNWNKANPGKRKAVKAKRRASILQRTPNWANLEAIKQIYENCPIGYHVDHIIPLQGKNVSGLHVAENLQYLTIKQNLSKGNKY